MWFYRKFRFCCTTRFTGFPWSVNSMQQVLRVEKLAVRLVFLPKPPTSMPAMTSRMLPRVIAVIFLFVIKGDEAI